jgi:hypothetical protein
MKLIDERTLFNASDEEVWHAIDDEHRERAGWRVEDMVRLLIELKAPKPIADRIFAELDRETAMMNRLLARIKNLNEAEKPKLPPVVDDKSLVPSDFFAPSPSVDELMAAGKPPLWRLSTNAIKHTLAMIEIERKQCTDRLAARLVNAQENPSLSSRAPDPKEESDTILLIMGSRQQEQIDATAQRIAIQKLYEDYARDRLNRQNEYHQKLRDGYKG